MKFEKQAQIVTLPRPTSIWPTVLAMSWIDALTSFGNTVHNTSTLLKAPARASKPAFATVCELNLLAMSVDKLCRRVQPQLSINWLLGRRTGCCLPKGTLYMECECKSFKGPAAAGEQG